MPDLRRGDHRIFITYRHDDARGHAGRLFDDLVESFGRNRVFMDIENIGAGMPWREVIEAAIARCDVAVVVIGRGWLTSTDAQGKRRLELTDDFVRFEVESTLRRELRVIPVLVERAELPTVHQLPDSLAALVDRHAIEIRDEKWRNDVRDLVEAIKRPPGVERRRRSRPLIASGIAVAVAVPIVIALLLTDSDPPRRSSAPTSSAPGTGSDVLLTTLPSDASAEGWEQEPGCTFSVEAGILTVSQEPSQPSFCKTGTVWPDFSNLLDPKPSKLLDDMRVTTTAELLSGEGKFGLRCRGRGSTNAWTGYMVSYMVSSIYPEHMSIFEEYRNGKRIETETVVEPLPARISTDSVHNLSLSCIGEDTVSIAFAVDDEPVFTDERPSAEPAGQAGVSMENIGSGTMEVEFRDFSIYALE